MYDQLDGLLKEAMKNLGSEETKNNKINITPAQALVISGLLTGVLSVFSVLVDANQSVQIVLAGSFKKKEDNNHLEELMAQIGHMPLDDVVKAMMNRLK